MTITCNICQEGLFTGEANESINSTICGHIYHRLCLHQWIEKSRTCPDCRTDLTNNDNIIKLMLHTEDTPTIPLPDKTKIEELKDFVEQLLKAESDFKNELELKCKKFQELVADNKNMNSASEQLKMKIKQLEEQVQMLSDTKSNLENELQKMKEDHRRASSANQKLTMENTKLKEDRAQLILKTKLFVNQLKEFTVDSFTFNADNSASGSKSLPKTNLPQRNTIQENDKGTLSTHTTIFNNTASSSNLSGPLNNTATTATKQSSTNTFTFGSPNGVLLNKFQFALPVAVKSSFLTTDSRSAATATTQTGNSFQSAWFSLPATTTSMSVDSKSNDVLSSPSDSNFRFPVSSTSASISDFRFTTDDNKNFALSGVGGSSLPVLRLANKNNNSSSVPGSGGSSVFSSLPPASSTDSTLRDFFSTTSVATPSPLPKVSFRYGSYGTLGSATNVTNTSSQPHFSSKTTPLILSDSKPDNVPGLSSFMESPMGNTSTSIGICSSTNMSTFGASATGSDTGDQSLKAHTLLQQQHSSLVPAPSVMTNSKPDDMLGSPFHFKSPTPTSTTNTSIGISSTNTSLFGSTGSGATSCVGGSLDTTFRKSITTAESIINNGTPSVNAPANPSLQQQQNSNQTDSGKFASNESLESVNSMMPSTKFETSIFGTSPLFRNATTSGSVTSIPQGQIFNSGFALATTQANNSNVVSFSSASNIASKQDT